MPQHSSVPADVHLLRTLLELFPSRKALGSWTEVLLTLMIETAGGCAPNLRANSKGWRSRLEDWTLQCPLIYCHRLWIPHAATPRQRIIGLNGVQWLEERPQMLREDGLSFRRHILAAEKTSSPAT